MHSRAKSPKGRILPLEKDWVARRTCKGLKTQSLYIVGCSASNIISPYCPQWGIGPQQCLFSTGSCLSAIACASPHDKSISIQFQLYFFRWFLGLPLFLLPAGVHLRATLRWLITVSSTFQDVDFDDSLLSVFIT